MINFGEREITQLVEMIWQSVLELDVTPSDDPVDIEHDDSLLTACVQITGA